MEVQKDAASKSGTRRGMLEGSSISMFILMPEISKLKCNQGLAKKGTIHIYSAQRSSGSRPLNINQLNYYGAPVYVEQNLCFNGALFALNLVSRTQEEKQQRREQQRLPEATYTKFYKGN